MKSLRRASRLFCYARFAGRMAMRSHISGGISSLYSLTEYALPHSMQRIKAVLQPNLNAASAPHALHFMRYFNRF
jgi:hypothetical protein